MKTDPANAFWYWLQPGLGVLLAAFSIYTYVMLFGFDGVGIPSIPAGINGIFVFPGLLLSIGINQLILRKRSPRIVTLTERIMLGVVIGLVVFLFVSGFDDEFSFSALFVWPILILVAVALTIVIVVKNATLAAPAVIPLTMADTTAADTTVAATTDAPTAYGAAPATQAQPEDPLDELFAGGKD